MLVACRFILLCVALLCQQPRAAELDLYPVQPEEMELVEPIHVSGNIAAHKTANLAPPVNGIVDSVHVGVGDRVEQDQPILTIRQIDLKLQATRLEQSVLVARAEHRQAEKDLERAQDLWERQAISEDELFDAQTQVEITAAELAIAEARRDEARQQLADTVVRAPFDGVITERNVDEGAYFSLFRPDGTPALQVQKIDIVVATVAVPERYLPRLALQTPVRVHIDSLGESHDSVIHVINDRIDPRTRAIDVRIGLENPDYRIKTGLFCRVEILPPARQALVVEAAAVVRLDKSYVYLAEDGRARRIEVATRMLESGEIEITDGLGADQWLLSGPDLARVTDGMALPDDVSRLTAGRALAKEE